MATRDFETRLDDTLTKFVQDKSRDTAISQVPDAADLISLADHLQILTPAPEPRLAEGRRKFLNEAARLQDSRAVQRRVLSLAFASVIVLIVGSLLVIIATTGLGFQANPTLQATLMPTQAPALSATPKSARSQNYAAPENANNALSAVQPHAPTPVPTPASLRTTSPQILAMTWSWLGA